MTAHSRHSPTITVLGSLNMDLVQTVKAPPGAGETVFGADLKMIPGGKGANQACAAARLGAAVRMVGRVGNDLFGEKLRANLAANNVDVSMVAVDERATGAATILVTPAGENRIVVSPGANGSVQPAGAAAAMTGVAPGDMLLCQLETPLDAVEAAMSVFKKQGGATILDPAPAALLPPALLHLVDILTPNQIEAVQLLSAAERSSFASGIQNLDDAARVAKFLLTKGPRCVVVKLGAQGALAVTSTGTTHLEGFAVSVVDTTAAGDTFNAALAVALSEGKAMPEAMRFGNAAAALSVTRLGAQDSLPSRIEVDDFLKETDVHRS